MDARILQLLLASILLMFSFNQNANADTFHVTSAGCGSGGIGEAIALANLSPGHDIIEIDASLEIDYACYYALEIFPISATESLTINGNYATINGNQIYISKSDGQVNPLFRADTSCPSSSTSIYIPAGFAPGFLNVGTRGQDSAGVDVVVNNLNIKGISSAAFVRENASLTFNNVAFKDIRDVAHCSTSNFTVEPGASLTLNGTSIGGSKRWDGAPYTALILGGTTAEPAGTLTINNGFFANNYMGLFADWHGDVVVNTAVFSNTGSMFIREGNSQITNAIFTNFGEAIESEFFVVDGGSLDLRASTLSFDEVNCDTSASSSCTYAETQGRLGNVAPVQVDNGGQFNLIESAIQVKYSGIGSHPTPLMTAVNGASFTADEYTFIQPILLSPAVDLRALTGQPNLITDAPALPASDDFLTYLSFSGPSSVTPMLGTMALPGLLVDNIPDAGVGGANELLDSYGNPITRDVYFNSRVDINDRRSTGAVQVSYAPHLEATAGHQLIRLQWSKPALPGLTGYEVCYGIGTQPDATDPTCAGTTMSFSGPDTLDGTLTGLTNGATYWLLVRATGGANGPWSNFATAIPLDDIDAPQVSAMGDNMAVNLSWAAPDDHGLGISGYIVLYRELGATDWIYWPQLLGASELTLSITGLTNGTAYEFAVQAVGNDGSFSALGLAQATPIDLIDTPVVSAVGMDMAAQVSWQAPDDHGRGIASYTVFYRELGAANWTQWSQSIPAGQTTLQVTGLTNGTTYEFGVQANGNDGSVSALGLAQATPVDLIDTPVVSAVGMDMAAQVSWQAPDDHGRGIASYTVFYRELGAANWTQWSQSIPAGQTTLQVTGLTNGTTYEFGVQANGNDGSVSGIGVAEATPVIDIVITGISGGSGSALWVLVLLGLFAWLKPSRRALPSLVIVGLLVGPQPKALAEDDWYLQLGYGQSDQNIDLAAIESGFMASGITLDSLQVDSDDDAVYLRLGYAFNDWFAAEISHMRFEEVDLIAIGITNDLAAITNDVLNALPYSSESTGIGVRASVPLSNCWYLDGRVGIAAWQDDLELDVGSRSFTGKRDDWDAYYGAGVRYTTAWGIDLGVEYTRTEFGETLNTVAATVAFRF